MREGSQATWPMGAFWKINDRVKAHIGQVAQPVMRPLAGEDPRLGSSSNFKKKSKKKNPPPSFELSH